jgi:hypothetical protein
MRALHLYIWILGILVIGVVLVTWMSMYKEGFQVEVPMPSQMPMPAQMPAPMPSQMPMPAQMPAPMPAAGQQAGESRLAPLMGPVVEIATGKVFNETLTDAHKKQLKDQYYTITNSLNTPTVLTTITNSLNTPTVLTFNLDRNAIQRESISINLPARYIRLRPSPKGFYDGYMSLSEVNVYDTANNKITRNKGVKVLASSTAQGGMSAQNLVYGSGTANLWPNYWSTNGNDNDKEFLLIDLGSIQNISSIEIYGAHNLNMNNLSQYVDPTASKRLAFMRIEITVDRSQDLASITNPAAGDPIPVKFPTNISAYALAKFGSPDAARGALIIDYNNIEKEMETNLYDPTRRAAWSADPQKETCAELNKLYTTFKSKQKEILAKTQDISGSIDLTGQLRDDNINFQNAYQSTCLQKPMSDACKNLASQDGPLFSLLTQYNTSQYDLYSNQIDISDNIQTIRDVYTLLSCTREADMGMPTGNELGTIDTTLLTAKLQTFSPYYLSPDILQNIVRSIVSANDIGGTLQYTSDTLVNINQIVNNIKTLTNTP